MNVIQKVFRIYDYNNVFYKFLCKKDKFIFAKLSIKSNEVFNKNVKKIEINKFKYKIRKQIELFSNITSIKIGNNIKHLSFFENGLFESINEIDLRENTRIYDYSSLYNLNHLKKLDLRGNYISDISFIGILTNLEEINLSRNYCRDYSPLSKLVNLKNIGLFGNLIKNIDFLVPLINLERINLGNNQLNDSFNPLLNLKKIIKLNISNNELNNISFVENLINLEEINLKDNDYINDFTPLTKLGKLKNINLSGIIFKDLKFLTKLSNIKEIIITDIKSNYKKVNKLPLLIQNCINYN